MRPHRPARGAASGSAPTTTRSSPACTRRPRTSSAPASRRSARCGRGESLHAANITGGLHHAMRGPGQRLLRLQRRRGRHPVAARPGRRAGRVRRRRRPPRRRRRGRSSTTTRGCSRSPCTRPARCSSPAPASPTDIGGPGAEGSAVNVALPPGTADAGWLRAFHAVVPPLVREFAPDVLVTQHGCDSHADDPLAHLMLSVDGQRAAYLALHDLAHEVAGGRWVATGGGGYALVEVVPRAWTHLLGDRRRRAARPGDRDPGGLARPRARAARASSRPRRLTDGRHAGLPDWCEGYDPDTWLDRAHRTRPGRRSSRCTASTRCPEPVDDRSRAGSRVVKRKSTRRRPLGCTFVNLFPMSHTRPYSHRCAARGSPVGKPVTVLHARERCG